MAALSAYAPALLTVSLTAMRENYRRICALAGAAVAPVLKADGYGTGAAQAFAALYEEGARQFFVATPEEGAALRALAEDTEIFILGGFYEGAEDFYMAAGLTPVLNALEELARWGMAAKRAGQKFPAALHFDTGMNRLGLGREETKRLREDSALLDGITLRLVMSHFACSDEKDHAMNARQAAAFADIAQSYPGVPKSLCNSSGIFRNKSWHHDIVRPGFSLFGGNPTPETGNPMRRVVDLSVRILQTRCAKTGESAGYGATHIFQNDTSLATVALGYADGFLRQGSNRAKLYYNGRPCPIVGRVSMDLIIVDAGDARLEAGALLEVLGPHQSVDDLAADCGTIGYEVLTALGRRYQRRYI